MTEAKPPLIDVIIPIHDPSRPLQRAIDSLTRSGLEVGSELRISIVCHNLAQTRVASALDSSAKTAVRFLDWNDGIPSPAGAFMHGISEATATYVSIMGSDDFLAPGALGAWASMAERLSLTALIPPEEHASGVRVRTPPVRTARRSKLDALKDRLAYRTAPLGLIRREAIARLGLDMSPRLRNGSDQLFGLKLWFSGEPIAYGRGLPAYIVGADASSRVTTTPRPAVDELRAVSELIADPWFESLPIMSRRAIVTKSVRVHVFAAATSRSVAGTWSTADQKFVAALLAECYAAAPEYQRVMSLADRNFTDALLEENTAIDTLRQLARVRRQFGSPKTLVTRDLNHLLAVDGPVRFMIASAML